MTESRCLGNARTSRKGKIQVYIDEDMYDAVVDLQANKDATKMLQYIENLTKHNNDFIAQACGCSKDEHDRLSRLSPETQEVEQHLRGCKIEPSPKDCSPDDNDYLRKCREDEGFRQREVKKMIEENNPS